MCLLVYMSYQTPKKSTKTSITIKKSEFIAYAYPVYSREEVLVNVATLKAHYPDARHHCFGYIIGDPNNTTSAGFDDDGEPNGTAGKPILNVLQHKAIGNCAIIVVRYFGGIKLGAGGLTRAYGNATQAVIDKLTLCPFVPKVQLIIQTDFANEAQLRYWLQVYHAELIAVHYSQQVEITSLLAQEALPAFKADVNQLARVIEYTAQ